MRKWEQFEEYVYERAVLGEDFNSIAVWEEFQPEGRAITRREASEYIQIYIKAQVRPNSTTLFVLSRVPGGRTTNAMWHVGERASDARNLGRQWADDAKRRIERFTEPTLVRIGAKNPRAIPAARAIAKGIEASLELMAAMLDGEAE